MSKFFLSFFLALSAMVLAYTPDFGKCTLRADAKQGSYYLFDGKRMVAHISVEKKEAFGQLKVAVQDGILSIDNRQATWGDGKVAVVTARFQGIDIKDVHRTPKGAQDPTRTNRAVFDIKGEGPTEIKVYFEGSETIDGQHKHFWRAKDKFLCGEWEKVQYESPVPDTVTAMHTRVDLRKHGKFYLRGVTFSSPKVEVAQLDPTRNYLYNGGAEKGWAGTFHNPLKVKRHDALGTWRNYLKQDINHELELALDDQVKYEGKYAFRMTYPQNTKLCSGYLRFAPVPFTSGQSLSVVFYAKADRKLTLDASFFVTSGVAVGQKIKLTTEWRKYELYLPKWGTDAGQAHVIGNWANASRITTWCIPA